MIANNKMVNHDNNTSLRSKRRRRSWMNMAMVATIAMELPRSSILFVESFGVVPDVAFMSKTPATTTMTTTTTTTQLASSMAGHHHHPTPPKAGLVHHVTKNAFQTIVSTRLNRFAASSSSMSADDDVDDATHRKRMRNRTPTNTVECHPCSTNNIITLAQGQFRCDASIDIQEPMKFGNNVIQFSSGRFDIKRLKVNLWNFRHQQQPQTNSESQRPFKPRYLNQFDLIGHNLTMTQDDLFQSSCITNGLVRLLQRILTKRGITLHDIHIESIMILSNGKLSIRAMTTPTASYTPSLHFEIRTGIDVTSRGHVVTFPGLELSIGPPGTNLFVPIFPELTVDLGHDAQIQHIHIDPITKQLHLSAKVTIVPDHTRRISKSFQQSKQSFAAMCSIDVGRWLTKMGRFAY